MTVNIVKDILRTYSSNDDVLVDYFMSVLGDTDNDIDMLHEIFHSWSIPTSVIDILMKQRDTICVSSNNYPCSPPHNNNPTNTNLVLSPPPPPLKNKPQPMDPVLKQKIIQSYDLEEIKGKPCKPYMHILQPNTLPKTRYLNNRVVTSKGERYIDINPKNKSREDK